MLIRLRPSLRRRDYAEIVKNTSINYNTMMPIKTLLSAAVMTIGMLLPIGAAAYTPPEEALFENDISDGFLAPPTSREIQARVDEQNRLRRERREAEQQATFGGHAAAPAEPDDADFTFSGTNDPNEDERDLEDILKDLDETLQNLQTQDSSTAQTAEERREERLARLEEERLHGAATDVMVYGDDALHSGAPLADTGPGTWLAAAIIAVATAWTMLRAGNPSTSGYAETTPR